MLVPSGFSKMAKKDSGEECEETFLVLFNIMYDIYIRMHKDIPT